MNNQQRYSRTIAAIQTNNYRFAAGFMCFGNRSRCDICCGIMFFQRTLDDSWAITLCSQYVLYILLAVGMNGRVYYP